jgi:hypothetical protein
LPLLLQTARLLAAAQPEDINFGLRSRVNVAFEDHRRKSVMKNVKIDLAVE